MNWPAIFLGCFIVGFVLSTMSFALSALHLNFHVRIPFAHQVHTHVHLPHVHVPHGGEQPSAQALSDGIAPFNFATVMAFLAWFGGTGYLLAARFAWLVIPALTAATLAGIAGAAIVFWLMAHVLWSPHENMMSSDYQMVGALGKVGTPIRPGRTGELIYSLGGTRHSCGARSADGSAIDKGVEVVVTAYDRGIAYVRRWTDLVDQDAR
jgi:membrane protein implicated in regulation of membrane protease activity